MRNKMKGKGKYMKISKSKTTGTAVALFLMFAMAFSLVALPASNAQTSYPSSVKTYAFIDANPSPLGVGQPIFLSFGIDKVPMTASQQYGDRWTNLTITVTKPDGTKETLTGFTSDNTGFAHTTYTPSATGNYTFVVTFGGQTLVGANPPPGGWSPNYEQYIGIYYQPSTSSLQTVEVGEEAVPSIPFNPLPTDYWQRPINMMNSNWNTISGNWFGTVAFTNGGLGYNATGNFNPYTTAPNTAHVLWTTPLAPGGLIGGEYGNTAHSNFYSTAQYECKFKAVVMDGVLYYTFTPGASTYPEGTIAIDIRTGQTIWHKSPDEMNGTLRMGWIINYISPNQYGGESYLWTVSGSTYSLYDATTGNYILQITDAPSRVKFMNTAPDGNLIGFYNNNTDPDHPTLVCWNASRAILVACPWFGPPPGDPNGWAWRPRYGTTVPWDYGIEWEAPIATDVDGVPISPLSLTPAEIADNTILLLAKPTGTWESWQIEAGYSIIDGSQLFLVNRTYPEMTRVSTHLVGGGMYVANDAEMQTYTAYSDTTGEQLWAATFPTNTFFGYISTYTPELAYGLLYCSTFDGHVYAFNATTGELAWNFYAGPAGYNTVYGSWPLKIVELVADGKVFLNGGHTYNPPLFRGSHAYCLNATTGKEVWSILSFCEANSPTTAASDGVVFLPNSYDNNLYCYGQGRSATTVDAPAVAIPHGSSLVIRGTVTDQSPGQTCLGIPAAGTPAIADECMTPWMEYLYMQQPKPTNATGVLVSIDVIDSNGNYRNIGTPTSDSSGMFSYTWTPDIPGDYKVIATFAGSESYFGSSAETSFHVSEAPAATPAPTPAPASLADLYFLPMSIVTVILIVIVGAIVILMLRKR
jgi:outer membrane protein assembly factor BamB